VAERSARDRRVQRVLLVEGAANAAALVLKAVVAAATGSAAVLGDAIHSLADLTNNAVALVALRIAAAPPDRDHPYGHRKYETLAVFALAVLLSVLAVEIAWRGLDREREVVQHSWSLGLMLGVLALNVALSLWENHWARRLDSDLLRADARHTFSDVLVTLAVIAGWQLAARGWFWLDALTALLVAALILALAYDLFRRAIPVLVDQSLIAPEDVETIVRAIPGVREIQGVRSSGLGQDGRIDVVVSVDPEHTTRESHAIADAIERALTQHFRARYVSVHVEPHVPR
jgi:cation diffusion facilitator family transporter